jgi:hypothetical protein
MELLELTAAAGRPWPGGAALTGASRSPSIHGYRETR